MANNRDIEEEDEDQCETVDSHRRNSEVNVESRKFNFEAIK